MIEIAALQVLFKLLVALGGLMAARAMLMWMDTAKSYFTDWLDNANDLSTSIYYSARLVGICLLIGLALS
jgi:hypothetical protein